MLFDSSVTPETDPVLWGSKCLSLDSSFARCRGVYTTEKFVSQNTLVYQDAIINCAETQILISTVLKWIERMISLTYQSGCLQSGRTSSSVRGTAPPHPLQNPLPPAGAAEPLPTLCHWCFTHCALYGMHRPTPYLYRNTAPCCSNPPCILRCSQERTEGGYR